MNWSYLLIALIASIALRITCLIPGKISELQNKRQTYIQQCLIQKEERLHPAVGRGIFTQALRTEYQVAAGKSFVVPW